ncbi:ethanolamine kinase 1-like [Mya arenaria]|uniref:ethanolamine kinase 1-like n=1 Tax=Mya arenaria TaxID=6604 RepID=UPI0022E608BA|nr:ethanolamine kinase 1-like [Mya arenaria]
MSFSPVQVDVTISPDEIQRNHCCKSTLRVLESVRPGWFSKTNPLESMKSKVFTGGISNQLYGYYLDGKFQEDVVLIRIYGKNSELMIDRDLEKKNIQILHAAGRCPPLYASFNNGIAYGFAHGVTLEVDTVRDEHIGRLIACEMIAVHSIRPDGCEVKTGLWDKINRFLELGPDSFEDPEKNKRLKTLVKSKEAMRKEVNFLRSHLEPLNSPVVFCHNDLLLKNIIYNKEQDRVSFIDHEYAMYNSEHFELGNHFAEYAGVDDVDFSRYPDRALQLRWLRNYLEEKAASEGRASDTVTEADVERCYVITNKFTLAAHMFWGLWGLVQARNSLIDFGFLEYAELKLNEYYNRKEEFLALRLQEV